MNHITRILSLLFLAPLFVFAQYLDEYPTKANTLLWKIEGKKLKKESYIFGTIHLIEKEKYDFPEQLESLIKNSEQITLEFGEIDQKEIFESLSLKKGTLMEFFTPEQADSIYAWAKENMGLGKEHFLMSFNQMKPFILVQLISNSGNNAQETESYDLNIMKMGNELNIPVNGLETIGQQMAIFDDIDTLTIRQMIMSSITDKHQGEMLMEELVKTYQNKNIDELHKLTMEQESTLKSIMFKILDQRNMNWIPQIEKLIKKKRTFIAVGAAHLGGENGVLRLLEKKGYRLTPVMI